MEVALGSVELKSRNMKGLMAELDTMDTPMMAWRVRRNYKVDHKDLFGHLHCPTPGHRALGVTKDLLSDDKDGHHSQGGLHFCSGEVAPLHTSG